MEVRVTWRSDLEAVAHVRIKKSCCVFACIRRKLNLSITVCALDIVEQTIPHHLVVVVVVVV